MSDEHDDDDDDSEPGSAPSRTPSSHIMMEGSFVLIQMLMGALRRQAIGSLGGKLDHNGVQPEDDDSPEIDRMEIRGLMIKLAAQGFRDVLYNGMIDLEHAKKFASDVAIELNMTLRKPKR